MQKFPTPPPPEMAPLPPEANPFAQHPDLQKLRADLHQNISDRERSLSLWLGLGMMAASMQAFRLRHAWALLAGAALVGRGITGHCPMYYCLGKDTRD